MGWFPARDKSNRVPPELLNWPMSSGSGTNGWQGGLLYHRQTQFGAGKNRDGKGDKRSDAKLLVEHARKFGYINGVKIGGKRHG